MARKRTFSQTQKRMFGVLFVGALAVGVIALWQTPLSGAMGSGVAPLLRASNGVGRGLFTLPAYFRSKAALSEENRKLQEDLRQSENSVLDRNHLYEENIALKERLGREAVPDAALAAVLMRPPEVPYDTLLIDMGSESGIAVGNRVAAYGTLVIGKVTEVTQKTARVSLFSSPGSTYEGFLRGTIPVTAEGKGGGSLSMEVPYDAHVAAGDTVSLAGIEANVVSVVEYVQPGQGDSAVTAYLRLPVNARELRFVDVWRTK